MIGAYRAGPIEMWIALALAKTCVGHSRKSGDRENVIPEFMQRDATPARLAAALRDVLEDTPQRRRQLEAFSRLDAIMATGGQRERASADIVARDAAESADIGLGFS